MQWKKEMINEMLKLLKVLKFANHCKVLKKFSKLIVDI